THIAYALTEYLGQTLMYTLKDDRVSHIDKDSSVFIKEQAGKFLTSAVGQTLAYDRRDSRIDPTSGYVLSLSNTYAGLGGKISYFRNSIGASWFYSPLEDIVLNVRGAFGGMERTGKKIRIVDSFQLGTESFRGFEYGGIGPRDSKSGDPLGGTRFWTGTI